MNHEQAPELTILGLGLAGSCLAWHWHWLGGKVIIIDRADPHASSRLAAGLITPISGKRLLPNEEFPVFYTAAQAFYQRVEQETGISCFQEKTAVRVLRDVAEAEIWAKKKNSLSPWLTPDQTKGLPPGLQAPHGHFWMQSAKLNVSTFLAATREYFTKWGHVYTASISVQEIKVTPESKVVQLPLAEHPSTPLLAFCQGFTQPENTPSWFNWLAWRPARGDILTCSVPQHGLEAHDYHAGIWLAPNSRDTFFLGSTYDWKNISTQPLMEGRAELLTKLARVWPSLAESLTVTAHHAGIRPIIRESRGFIGRHPTTPQLAFFNGLGSKGSLQAPRLAGMLARHLKVGEAISSAHDILSNSS